MKKKRIIIIAYLFLVYLAMLMLNSCSGVPRPQDGVLDTKILSVDTLDQCTYRYTISFSDTSENSQPGWYWVGLKKNSNTGNPIVAYSHAEYLSPRFWDYDMSVDLDITAEITSKDEVFATAEKTEDSSYTGNHSWTTSSDQSDYPIDFDSFPSSCYGFKIDLSIDDWSIYDQDKPCVFISREPAMPDLTADITQAGPIEGFVDWELVISYTRSERIDYDTITANNMNWMETWDIKDSMGDMIRGGQASLSCFSQALGTTRHLDFGIRAYNEYECVIEDYIDNLDGSMWYHKYVAKHESGEQNGRRYLQFNEKGSYNCWSSDVKYTPNWGEDPYGPGGFGLYQLTWFGVPEAGPPNAQELWDWKENVAAGTGWLAYHQDGHASAANQYMAEERAQASIYGSDYYWVPDEHVGNVTFADWSDKIIEHAVAMKRYNGIGGTGNRQYCEWLENENRWSFNRLNDFDPPFNYVERVCLVVP